jgi:antitoxin component YwqK of YwqJK toxin-antitoxin module
MNRGYLHIALASLILMVNFSCNHSSRQDRGSKGKNEPRVITKRRDDGTLSSVNQVDEEGRVNGVRVTYYADGKSIHSKLTFSHGIKEGPSIRYYKNGQIFEHTGFKNGEKDGPTRKYYKDGKLLSECTYKNGDVEPGLKEYNEDGTLITSYPEIRFREISHLASRDRIDLEVYCTERNRGVKYFLLDQTGVGNERTYLISEHSSAMMQYYVKPGDALDKKIEILAEIPTELGNVMAKKLYYHLQVSNMK